MSSKPNIKILIACHKPSELPKNDLLLPIQVGAANAKADLGLQRDDDGEDNISAKNSGYCELTAIYWAWKNLDADYYGLFHYRRFYSFADEKLPEANDGTMMVCAKILSPKVFHKYGLDDENKMRSMIEPYDLIVHNARSVRGLPTPVGTTGNTVYKHYKLHDGTIIKISDIDQMMDIIKRKYPKIYPYIKDYLNGTTYLGYNMFIMKKKFFNAMCDFEFNILRETEKFIDPDLPNRSINSNRIYGYLAEILTSAYIYYIEQSNPQLKINHLQMVQAFKTKPIEPLNPIKNRTPIAINFTEGTVDQSYYLYTTINQLTKVQSAPQDIILIHKGDNIPKVIRKLIQDLTSNKTSIRFIDFSDYLDQLSELHNKPINIELGLAIPQLLPHYNKVVLLDWNTWVRSDLSELANIDLGEYEFAAAQNVLDYDMFGINSEHRVSIASNLNSTYRINLQPHSIFSTAVMVLNIPKLAKSITENKALEVTKKYESYSDYHSFLAWYSLSLKWKLINQTYNYQLPTNGSIGYTLTFYTPIDIGNAWRKLEDSYKIGYFLPNDLDSIESSDFSLEFYTAMHNTSVWPLFVMIRTSKPVKQQKTSWRRKLMPINSRRREFIKGLLPRGSKRRAVIEKVYWKLIKH